MIDSEECETALKHLAPDIYKGLISTHSEEPMDH